MAARKSISKKLRFEVFKRDGFKCQYCGESSPDVILHVDHIHPVSKGGDNDVMNLITSCADCNSGKSDRVLSDDSIIDKQRAQLQELSERREQLEMMIEWRDGLKNIRAEWLQAIVKQIEVEMSPWLLTEGGVDSVRKWLVKFSPEELIAAIDASSIKYLQGDYRDVDDFFDAIPKIAEVKRKPENEHKILYVRGILRNRLSYINEQTCLTLLRGAVESGADVDQLIAYAKSVRTWSNFKDEMESIING